MTAPPNVVVIEVPAPAQTRAARVREIRDACDAIVATTILLGGSPATAYLAAAQLAYGLEEPERCPRRWPK